MNEDIEEKRKNKEQLNSFELLERALLLGKGEPQSKEEDKQTIPLQQSIYHNVIEMDQVIRQSFIPIRYNSTKNRTNEKSFLSPQFLNPFQKELVKTLEQEQSIAFLSHKKKQNINTSKMIMQYCRKMQKKILLVCQNQDMLKEIQPILRLSQIQQSLKNSQNQDPSQWTTLAKLRITIIQDMSKLQRFNSVLFYKMQLRDQRYQEILITLPLQLNYFIIFKEQMSNISTIMYWLAKLRFRPFHLLYKKQKSQYPLIYGITASTKGIYRLINVEGQIQNSNLQRLNKSLQTAQLFSSGNKIKKQPTVQQNLNNIVKLLYSLNMFPIACYTGSKKNVEKYARILCQNVDFTAKQEKQKVQLYYQATIDIVQQALSLKSLSVAKEYLIRGIGIFHEGLSPLVNQLVLLLFKEKILKVILTNKLNNSLDYKSLFVAQVNLKNKAYFKSLQSYIYQSDQQDKMILLYIEEKVEHESLKALINKNLQPTNSNFNLNMFKYLNYLTFEDMDAEYVLARTFKQLQNREQVEKLKARKQFIQQLIDSIIFEDIEPVKALHIIKTRKQHIQEQIFKITYSPQNVIPYMTVGRIVSLQVDQTDWGLGVVVNFLRFEEGKSQASYFVDVLVYIRYDPNNLNPQPIPFIQQQGKMQVLTFSLSCIKSIKTITFSSLPNNLKQMENKNIVYKSLKKLQTFNMKPVSIHVHNRQIQKLKDQLAQISSQLSKLSYLEPIYSEYLNKLNLQKQQHTLKMQIQRFSALVQKDKLKSLNKVAKHMDYIKKKRLTEVGMAVGCLETHFCMLIVSLMKEKFYQKLSGAQIAALSVALIEDNRINTERFKIANLRLRDGLDLMMQQTKEIFKVMKKHKFEVSEEQQLQNIKQQYIQPVLNWCQGQQLQEICSTNNLYEGTFLDIIHKLIELLNQIKKAASTLSEKQTELKLDEAIARVSRGLANNCSSLF